ncbi:MAG: acetyl-CoA carboxylase biotin carboxyl carrier protein subunit, partial [Myxococcales bacterium]|nr:acetyl-CoA carboxylase biotin carboxyl carrier protein subunit [Myxococcales bacterium]
EAMKMENEFRSPIDGEVVEIGVAAGTTIEGNTMLVVVEPR